MGRAGGDLHVSSIRLDRRPTVAGRHVARNAAQGEWRSHGFFYRSDQFNFARWGVPAAYFQSGHDFIGKPDGWGKKMREEWEDKHYHQPSDEYSAAFRYEGISR